MIKAARRPALLSDDRWPDYSDKDNFAGVVCRAASS